MSNPDHPSIAWKDRTVLVLISGALCGALLLICGYIVIFTHERRTVVSRDWVEHTHEVIDALDRVSHLFDQMETDHSFAGTDTNGVLLKTDKERGLSLELTALRLQHLVSDNPDQSAKIPALLACATTLSHAADSPALFRNLDLDVFNDCFRTATVMTAEERRLLKLRNDRAQENNDTTIVEAIVYVLCSFVGLMGLFWFLIRSAMYRRVLANELLHANADLSKTVDELQLRSSDLQMLTLFRDELQLCVTPKEAQDSASQFISQLVPGSSGAICLTNESRNIVERITEWGETGDEAWSVPEILEAFSPDQCCGLRSGRPRWQHAGASEVNCSHFAGAAPLSYACLPLAAQGESLGFITICSEDEGLRDLEARSDTLRQMVELTAMTLASLKLRVKLQNQSIRDPLTELYNRGFMEIAFEREIRRAVRRRSTLAVFMLDVDHFKSFNDGHGHAAGDTALREVAAVFRRCVRAEDIICRYGGEEFAIILPDIDEAVALERAEMIRVGVSEMRLSRHEQSLPQVTITIGVAMYPESGETAEHLLRGADEALYRAKRSGRNQVLYTEVMAHS